MHKEVQVTPTTLTQGSWVRIALAAWMKFRDVSVFVLSCGGIGFSMGRSHLPGVRQNLLKDSVSEITSQVE
jgi:hypothetical protein